MSFTLREAVSLATSSAANVGHPGRCHPYRQIQMDVASFVYENFQIQKRVAPRTHITDL